MPRIKTLLAWRADGQPEHEDMTAIGGRINVLLEESEIVKTITQLAEAAGISPGVMGDIIDGTIKTPSRPVLVGIANALDVDVDELIELLDDEALEMAGESFTMVQEN